MDRVTPSEGLHPALRAVSDAVLAVAAELSVEEVLQRLVDGARELAGARYAALGIPDGAGGFARFLVSGMTEELIAAMGPLPRTHGLLGAMLETRVAFRTDDIHDHPRFHGWWPDRHPDMRSFLGVPIVAPEGVIGAFYLTEKEDAPAFGAADQELIELLGAHAAIAITNARLYERSRELTIVAERNRLALELHDVVSQKLFGLILAADSALTLLDGDGDGDGDPDGRRAGARAQIARAHELGREAQAELRSLILELRPPDLDRDGLAGVLRKHAELVGQVHAADVRVEVDVDRELDVGGLDPAGAGAGAAAGAAAGDGRRDLEILRIAQEALQNAVRHAAARRIRVRLGRGEDGLVLVVCDDGDGFDPRDPELRSRHLGLTSMQERARRLGGRLEIVSAPGAGTTVTLTVGHG
ncbi:MAG: GAF domain-containing sensor histidine kinase [Actinobacteria bacterium]|nr:GAF domain-containing sensor histidine kinase [Actinomycetota bacterium]